ncbi:MAG: hypothetical protein BGO26_10385 [Actinobacteria bacterium 69-20]|nr:transposase [Actinomycetota bacterium]OJV25422.1 MAG: hypothetical protein BGO26_10385 [Actinobacteria bacterium 69-20]
MRYPDALRVEAIRRVQRDGQSVGRVAADLSIAPSTLRGWVRPRSEFVASPAERSEIRPGNPRAAEIPVSSIPVPGTDAGERGRPTARLPIISTPADPVPPAGESTVGRTYPSAYLAAVLALALAVALAALLRPSHALLHIGIVIHLLGFTVGFGAVTVVDWYGLLWLAGRRDLVEVRRLVDAATPLIWMGIVALLASAPLVHPDLTAAHTWIKIGAVLIVVVNGVWTQGLSTQLATLPVARRDRAHTPLTLRRRIYASAATSQAAWWTAIVIGLISDAARN